MLMELDENPTRKQIITLLNREKNLTVAGMAKHMGVTPMAVRQHLLYLENRGIINYKPKKNGIGRPVFLYNLTDKAIESFPKTYGSFIKDLLGIIEGEDGRKKLDRIFSKQREQKIVVKQKALEGKKTIKDKIKALARQLDKDGFMVDYEETEDAYIFKQYNCLLSCIASEYPEVCKHELQMYRDLIGHDIDRVAWKVNGDSACVYTFPKR
jgi:predicted ArsR family transcriptional regulator